MDFSNLKNLDREKTPYSYNRLGREQNKRIIKLLLYGFFRVKFSIDMACNNY